MRLAYNQLKEIMTTAAKKTYTHNMYKTVDDINVLQTDVYGIERKPFGTEPNECISRSVISLAEGDSILHGVTLVHVVLTESGINYLKEECHDLNIDPADVNTFLGSARIELVDTFHHEFNVVIFPYKRDMRPVMLKEDHIELIIPGFFSNHSEYSFDINWSLDKPSSKEQK